MYDEDECLERIGLFKQKYARTFATYVDVEGIELVLIRISPGPNSALTLRLTLG